MNIEKMSKTNGETTYEGKRYVLLQQAYPDGPADGDWYYTADAICPDDGADEDGLYLVYRITWYPLQEYLDVVGTDEDFDEGWACDWDNPDGVECYGAMWYSLDDGYRFI